MSIGLVLILPSRIGPLAGRTSALLDLTTIQIQPDPPATTVLEVPAVNCHNKSQHDTEVYLRIYYDQFHHRWPIIHRPSHEEEQIETEEITSMTDYLDRIALVSDVDGLDRNENSITLIFTCTILFPLH